jgi:hypothetical protein
MQCSLLTHCCAKEVVLVGPGLSFVLEVLVLVLVFEVEVSVLVLVLIQFQSLGLGLESCSLGLSLGLESVGLDYITDTDLQQVASTAVHCKSVKR